MYFGALYRHHSGIHTIHNGQTMYERKFAVDTVIVYYTDMCFYVYFTSHQYIIFIIQAPNPTSGL